MARRQNGKLPRHFPLSALVTALFAILTLTSGMVGYLLGRNVARPTGELVDTIVLSPGQSSSQEAVHYLSGRLLFNSGEPFSGATVLLTDTGKSDVTDSRGKFYFSGVRAGSHRLEVKNSAGETVTDMELTLDFSGEVSAEFGKGYSSFRMTEDARMLEFTITVGDNDLEVEEDSAYFVTRDGTVVDFGGGSLTVQKPAVAILPNVDVVSPDGQVLLPSKGTVVTPQGEEVDVAPGEEVMPGVTVEEDGSVRIGDDTVVTPDGEITLPDGSTAEVGDDVIVAEDGRVEEVPELPDVFYPPEPLPEQPEQSPVDSPDEGQDPAGDSSAAGPVVDDPMADDPAEDGAPEPEGDRSGFAVVDTATGKTWKQQSIIDLFKNRIGGSQTRAGQDEPAAPGSKGYYEFRLENPEEYDISYTITLEEQSFHLPIRYSVLNADTNYSYLYRERITSPEEPLISAELTIPAHSEQRFRIEWDWMYEDWYNVKRDDALDLAAAKSEDRTYILSVMLNAAEILRTPQAEDQPDVSYDGELRYPGKR